MVRSMAFFVDRGWKPLLLHMSFLPLFFLVEGHLAAVSLDGASSSAAPTDAAAEASSSGAPAEDDSKKSNKKKDKKSKKNAIIVTMLRRAGRNVTTVSGLERYDVDLKKASKLFSSKFACGCTTHKNPSQVLEILIQGDVSYDVAPVIMANWPNITEDDFEYIEK